MKLIETAGRKSGLHIRTFNDPKNADTAMISVIGPQKQVAELVSEAIDNGYKPDLGIVAYGYSKDGANAHLVAVADTARKSQIDTANLSEIHLDGYDYQSFVTTMDDGVNIVALDEGTKINKRNGQAYGNFCAGIFKKGQLRNASSPTATLLLHSRPGVRALFASRYGKKGALTQVEVPFDGVPVFDVVNRETLIAAKQGTSTVYAVRVQNIAKMFTEQTTPIWSKTELDIEQIEDLSLEVDKGNTVILTATDDDKRRLIPATVVWNKDSNGCWQFSMKLNTKQAITDLPKGVAAPQRITPSFIAASDRNDGTKPVRTTGTTIDNYARGNKPLARFVQKAAQGEFTAAA